MFSSCACFGLELGRRAGGRRRLRNVSFGGEGQEGVGEGGGASIVKLRCVGFSFGLSEGVAVLTCAILLKWRVEKCGDRC